MELMIDIAKVNLYIVELAHRIVFGKLTRSLIPSLRPQRRGRKPPKQLIPRPRHLKLRKIYMIISTL